MQNQREPYESSRREMNYQKYRTQGPNSKEQRFVPYAEVASCRKLAQLHWHFGK